VPHPVVRLEDLRPGVDPIVVEVPSDRAAPAFVVGSVETPARTLPSEVRTWIRHRRYDFDGRWGSEGQVDAAGRFRIGPLVPGRYDLRVGSGSLGWRILDDVLLEGGEERDLGAVRLEAPGFLVVRLHNRLPWPSLAGQGAELVDSEGNPVERWGVLEGALPPRIALGPGRYVLRMTGLTAVSFDHPFEIQPELETPLDVEVRQGSHRSVLFEEPERDPPAARVDAVVRDAQGRAVLTARCRRFPDRRLWVLSGGFEPGTYLVESKSDTGLRATETIEIPDLEPTQKPFEFRLR
jgi:hypothetical protein